MTRKPYNPRDNLYFSLQFGKKIKNFPQNEETLPQKTKKWKLFPNILFGNNVKQAGAELCQAQHSFSELLTS